MGRPWRPYSKAVFLKCNLGKQIKPQGWDNWGKAENEKTAYYAEYKNKGAGYKPESRVAWSHQLTDEEAKEYTVEKIFRIGIQMRLRSRNGSKNIECQL